jgi:hypothetical protein
MKLFYPETNGKPRDCCPGKALWMTRSQMSTMAERGGRLNG